MTPLVLRIQIAVCYSLAKRRTKPPEEAPSGLATKPSERGFFQALPAPQRAPDVRPHTALRGVEITAGEHTFRHLTGDLA